MRIQIMITDYSVMRDWCKMRPIIELVKLFKYQPFIVVFKRSHRWLLAGGFLHKLYSTFQLPLDP